MAYTSISVPVTKTYLKGKLKILKDFCITPTTEEIEEIKACKTEVQLDNYCYALIQRRISEMPKPKKKLKWYAEKKRS